MGVAQVKCSNKCTFLDPEGLQQEAVGAIHPPQEGGVGGKPQPLQRTHALPWSVGLPSFSLLETLP